MGGIFALAFCPVSATLYFGFIIPLAAAQSAPFVLPLVERTWHSFAGYSHSPLLDFGFKNISSITGLAGRIDKFIRPATGWIFIAAGIYLALRDIFSII